VGLAECLWRCVGTMLGKRQHNRLLSVATPQPPGPPGGFVLWFAHGARGGGEDDSMIPTVKFRHVIAAAMLVFAAGGSRGRLTQTPSSPDSAR